MPQYFHIWRNKQTIQGLWPNCIWRDKQNQEKILVLEPKTRKTKCILHKNSLLDFFQTYTSRRVAYLCIFLYVKSLLCRRKTMCHSSIPSLHSQSHLITKQPRDKNSEPCQQILHGFRNEHCQHNIWWTRTTLTGVSIKSPQCTNSKGYFNEIFTNICESWYEPFEKYTSRSPGWFKNL